MKSMYAEAILTIPETTHQTSPAVERCYDATTSDLDDLERGVSAEVLMTSVDDTAETVTLRFRGRTIQAQPLDTRRFVREMARYISFN